MKTARAIALRGASRLTDNLEVVMSISLRCTALLLTAVVAAGCDRDVDRTTAPTRPDVRPGLALAVPTTANPMVVAGAYHGCALRAEGTIACWGDNANGEASPPAGIYTQVSTRGETACALSQAGEASCWGLWGLPAPGGPFVQVSAGNFTSCGLRPDGSLSCWGYGGFGVASPPSGNFTQVSVGRGHACALKDNGTIACWGTDVFGRISNTPGAPTGRKFTQVSSGIVHSCALLDDGSAKCWGDNQFGQLDVPALPAGVQYTQVSAGTADFYDPVYSFHSCGLRSDGTAVCWGGGGQGQLNVPALPAGVTYTSISAGWFHSCASRSDGAVLCWGLYTAGQINVPPTLNLLKRTQPIVFTPPVPNPAAFGTVFDLVPNTGSGSPVVLQSLTPAVCVINESMTSVSFLAQGTCSFTVDRAGNADYEPAQLTVTVTVAKKPQSIAFDPALPAEAPIGSQLSVTATGGASGNPVAFSVLTPGTCALSGNVLSLTNVGACTVAADQVGNAEYEAAPQQTATVAVRWPFAGFVGLKAPPALNTGIRPGNTVAMRFSLGGNRGMSVLAGSPTVAAYPCNSTLPPPGAGSPNVGTLDYNATAQQYTYNYVTLKSRASKSCVQFSLTLADGSIHTALFQFK